MYIKIFSCFILLISLTGFSQENKRNFMITRQPYAAGKFYLENPEKLSNELNKLFKEAKPKSLNNVVAIISPHAGYVFSGEVTASGFNQLDKNSQFENVFIIASSHTMLFEGASVYCNGNYNTPLGDVEVNTELALKIVNESNNIIQNYPEPHYNEHSIEVQLPFLQNKFGNKLKIIPIIIGTDSIEVCKKIADVLKPYFNSRNLFVISSDFSHYPSYIDAVEVDKNTAIAITSNNPEILIKALRNNEQKKYKNLVTSLCGWTSVITFLYITEKENVKFNLIDYKNSGDSFYGDKEEVVGYNSIVVTNNNENTFCLSDSDKNVLLSIARNSIENKLLKKSYNIDSSNFNNSLRTNCGAFVTLHINDSLRGCIGSFSQNEPLYSVINKMALASAFEDYRFNKLTATELNKIKIEISVLTPLKKIKSIDEIKLGVNGIYISKGNNSGTFLPQVALETGWTLEEFLGHCSQDKAGIGWNGWKDAEIFIYEAIVFEE